MKAKKRLLVIAAIVALTFLGYRYYPALNIITGYAAKNMASGVFLAERDQKLIEENDNGFFPINLANYTIDYDTQSVTSSLFGLMKRKAIYKEGVGAVLIDEESNEELQIKIPNRYSIDTKSPYPYGDLPQKDTIFSEVNYTSLNEAVENAFDKEGERKKQTRSVLVVYKDQIVAEKYIAGFDKASLMHGWSMAKSFTSTVYGILQKKKGLAIDESVDLDLWKDDNRKHITYSNLLQMNSGLAWDEGYFSVSDVTSMLYLSSDMGEVQLDKPLAGAPNETWNYSSGTTNLISGLLMRRMFHSHQEYADFWYKEFIDKIGMNSMVLEVDPTGNYISSSYSWATTRDWAKFGLLYLHQGNWNGEQVLDSSFVKYVSTPTNDSEGNYGAQFWLNAGSKFPDAPLDMFYSSGFKGQFVFIVPSEDVVIVRTGLAGEKKIDLNAFIKDIVESLRQ